MSGYNLLSDEPSTGGVNVTVMEPKAEWVPEDRVRALDRAGNMIPRVVRVTFDEPATEGRAVVVRLTPLNGGDGVDAWRIRFGPDGEQQQIMGEVVRRWVKVVSVEEYERTNQDATKGASVSDPIMRFTATEATYDECKQVAEEFARRTEVLGAIDAARAELMRVERRVSIGCEVSNVLYLSGRPMGAVELLRAARERYPDATEVEVSQGLMDNFNKGLVVPATDIGAGEPNVIYRTALARVCDNDLDTPTVVN